MLETEKVKQERLNRIKREKEEQLKEECTFKPVNRKCPSYVVRMAEGHRASRSNTTTPRRQQTGHTFGYSSRTPLGGKSSNVSHISGQSRRSGGRSAASGGTKATTASGKARRRYESQNRELFSDGAGSRGYTHSTAGGPSVSRTYDSDSERPQWR